MQIWIYKKIRNNIYIYKIILAALDPGFDCLIEKGLTTHVNPCGSFCVVCQRREKRIRRDSRGDERERQGRKENEETEEIKTSPLYPYLLQG